MTYLPYSIDVQRCGTAHCGLDLPWHAGDSQQLYKINDDRIDPGWCWRDQPINYRFNSLGYRMCEFKDLRWPRYYAVFGCSCTVGIGLPREQLWWDQISRELDLDVVNAAVQGGGSSVVLTNLAHLLAHCEVKPRFVVIQWPDPRRRTLVDRSVNPLLVMSRAVDTLDKRSRRWYEYVLTNDHLWQWDWWTVRSTAQALCAVAGVPLFEYSYEQPLVQWGIRTVYMLPPKPKLDLSWVNQMARDIQIEGQHIWAHPGTYAQEQILALVRPWLVKQQLT